MAGEKATTSGTEIPRKRLFISYGHDKHVGFAGNLSRDLRSRGHEVWFDAERLKPGGDWEAYITEGLEWVSQAAGNARLLLLMTPHSVRRPDGYCLNEIARALDRKLTIIPVMVVWCEPPLSICRIQWLDMRDCIPLEKRQQRYEAKFARLLEAIEHDHLSFEGVQARLLQRLQSDDSILHVWEVQSGPGLHPMEIRVNTKHAWIHAFATAANAPRAVLASVSKTDHRPYLQVLDLENGKLARAMEGHTSTIGKLSITPDGHWIVSGSSDETLRVWDADNGKCVASFSLDGSPWDCEISSDGTTVIARTSRHVVIFAVEGIDLMRDSFDRRTLHLSEAHSGITP